MKDEAITSKIITEVIVLKDTSKVSIEHVLVWAQRVEVQRTQKAVLENIRDTKDFNLIRSDRQRPDQNSQQRHIVKQKIIENYRYSGMTHPQKQCLANGKICSRYGTVNHYKVVCRSIQKQSQKSPERNRAVYEVQHDEEPYMWKQRDSSRDFDLVNIRYLNFASISSVIFTKLGLSTSQKRT